MISSKNMNILAWILMAAAFFGCVFAMYVLKDKSGDTDERIYGENHSITYTEDDGYGDFSDAERIDLNGGAAVSDSKNVVVENNVITVLDAGSYVISGSLDNGRIVVDCENSGVVRLILNGASINSEDFSAIYIAQADKTVISAAADTTNHISDGKTYGEGLMTDGKPDAAIYSKDDLVINGEGRLIVDGSFSDAIKSNDGLKIVGADLEINAADDAISANDFIGIIESSITADSQGDGIICDDNDSDRGFIAVEDSSITIESGGDGISASSALYLDRETADIICGGGADEIATVQNDFFGRGEKVRQPAQAQESEEDEPSKKALKAGTNIVINNGSFVLDSVDDCIHSNGDISVRGGSFKLSTEDDGVHADDDLTVNCESLDVIRCREGIEGDRIVIDGGDISILSSDDGINAAGPSENGGFGGPMGMRNAEITDENTYLTINGGNIYVETNGDGLDSNGAAVLNGGQVYVYGPENSGNSSVDSEYGFAINGGSILAVGSSGMAEPPSEISAQKSLVFYTDEIFESGSEICIKDSKQNTIFSGESPKTFDCVLASSGDIASGEEYSLFIDDKEVGSVKAENTVSSYGSGGMTGGMARRGRMRDMTDEGGTVAAPEGMPQSNRHFNGMNGDDIMKMPADTERNEKNGENGEIGEIGAGRGGDVSEGEPVGGQWQGRPPREDVAGRTGEENPSRAYMGGRPSAENSAADILKELFPCIVLITVLILSFLFVIFYKRKHY